MNHVEIRAALVQELAEACAPVRVAEEEPDVVAGVCVVVCWTGCREDREVGWLHTFEERIILTGHDNAAAHFPERDVAVQAVVETVRRFKDTSRSWRAAQVTCAPGTVEVGKAPKPAVICRHVVSDPSDALSS